MKVRNLLTGGILMTLLTAGMTMPALAANKYVYMPSKVVSYEKKGTAYKKTDTATFSYKKNKLTKIKYKSVKHTRVYKYKKNKAVGFYYTGKHEEKAWSYFNKYQLKYSGNKLSKRIHPGEMFGSVTYTYSYAGGRIAKITEADGGHKNTYLFSDYDVNGNPRKVICSGGGTGDMMGEIPSFRRILDISYLYGKHQVVKQISVHDVETVYEDQIDVRDRYEKYTCSGSKKVKSSSVSKNWVYDWIVDEILL